MGWEVDSPHNKITACFASPGIWIRVSGFPPSQNYLGSFVLQPEILSHSSDSAGDFSESADDFSESAVDCWKDNTGIPSGTCKIPYTL